MVLYEIAYELRIPVYLLLEEMPYHELRCWLEFFERRPIGWREDNRTSILLQAWGVKEKPEKIFRSLEVIKQQASKQNFQESPLSLKAKLAALMARSTEESPWSDAKNESKK
jgi:hypothetical protein